MDKTTTFARFRQAFEYLKDKGHLRKQNDLVDLLGIGKSHISEFVNGKENYFTEKNLTKFADAFSEYVNKKWLLTGEGVMIVPSTNLRPHVNAKAAAGFMTAISEGEYGKDLKPVIPFMKDYDFTIEVEGRSMFPYYRPGDILACRIADDSFNPPINKICVIDGHDGAVVKEIVGINEDGTAIICHSFNPDPRYRDYEIEFSGINQIAVVVGMIRPEE